MQEVIGLPPYIFVADAGRSQGVDLGIRDTQQHGRTRPTEPRSPLLPRFGNIGTETAAVYVEGGFIDHSGKVTVTGTWEIEKLGFFRDSAGTSNGCASNKY